MALTLERLTAFAGLTPARGTIPIKANTRIFKGGMVALDSAGRAMPAGLISAGALTAIGKASATYDNRTGSELGGAADAVNVEVEYGVFGWTSATGGGDDIAADDVGKVCYQKDDQTVALTNASDTRGLAGFITEVRNGQVFVYMGPHVAGLIVIAASEASQLDTAQTDIDTAQADILDLQTDGGVGSQMFALTDWKEVTAGGAVGATAAGGGNLSSDTTPILGAEATSEAMSILWAAANADIIQASIALPVDFDDAANATLDLWVKTDNTSVDAATFTVNTSWNNGVQVVDTATDAAPASAAHKITATIAAADIPAGAEFVNIQLVPAAHAIDGVILLAARLNYTRVQTAT